MLKQTHDQPLDSNGRLFTLCVIHEINPKQEEQAQANSVIGGISVCAEHLHTISQILRAGHTMSTIMTRALDGTFE